MKFFLFICLTTAALRNIEGTWRYCYPESCRGSKHTLCEYKPGEIGLQCNKVLENTITREERREIVKTHNILREKVARGLESRGRPGPQPRGFIGKLRWDKTLAIVAQRWANQCIFNHDPCHDVKRFRVGQNVGYTGNNTKYFDKLSVLITNWYDEVKYFPNYLVKNFQPVYDQVITHYSNIVWGNTTRVGCGLVRHYTYRHMYRTHLVCNYGAQGNWIGSKVYETF